MATATGIEEIKLWEMLKEKDELGDVCEQARYTKVCAISRHFELLSRAPLYREGGSFTFGSSVICVRERERERERIEARR